MVSEELTNHSKEGTTARETVSWLIRSSVKTEISVPPDLGFTVTMDEFANTLATLSRANQLPTEVSRQIVPWDDRAVTQSRILVEHTNPRFDAVKLIVGLDRVGSFYYIEERLCWDLPCNLPEYPRRRITYRPTEPEISTSTIASYIVGGIIFLVTIIGPIIALGLIIREFASLGKRHEQYQLDLADWEVTRSFDEAIDAWFKHIGEFDNHSRTDDELSRFYLAVKSTIRQAVQILFLDRRAELRNYQEKEMSRQDLEAELKRRKQRTLIGEWL